MLKFSTNIDYRLPAQAFFTILESLRCAGGIDNIEIKPNCADNFESKYFA